MSQGFLSICLQAERLGIEQTSTLLSLNHILSSFMKPSTAYNELKYILDNIRAPQRLDEHPWTRSLVVRRGVLDDNSLDQKAPGHQLIAVLSSLFRQMMPSTPPKRGKRLDTRWCQFGMLAAEYFAPFLYGAIYPSSLRDAWGRIDHAIPFFVFGKSGYDLPEVETSRYSLFDDDTEPAPISTLSDWHTRGLQRLADLFLDNEQYLSQKLSQSSPVLHPPGGEVHLRKGEKDNPTSSLLKDVGSPKARGQRSKLYKRWAGMAVAILLLVVIMLVGFKGWRIYREAKTVKDDLVQIQSLLGSNPSVASFGQAGPLLSNSRQHLALLKSEVGPLLWTGKYLAWVPRYGGELAQAEALLDMTNGLLVAADETAQGIAPLSQELQTQDQHPRSSEIVKLLVDAQPHFSDANVALNEAIEARDRLDVVCLSNDIRSLVTDKVDPYLSLLQDGLAFAIALPKLAGASASGPQTYLILMQNEDELRATGGFLTDVGTVVVKDGDIVSDNFEISSDLDDLTKPYPPAPWQLERYMAAHILLLRDSNWSPDFPTSAALAEYLYAYTRFHSADGIIAIDQRAVQMLLKVFGPINLEDVPYPITSENVIEYMRAAKFDSGDLPYDPNHRKDFIGVLGEAILLRLKSGQNISLEALSKVLIDALDQKHILVQLDDPTMALVLAGRGWDGAVRPGSGDYLMVVDSNVGFTKSNAVIDSKVNYQVDLSNLANPVAELKVTYTNHASENVPCTSIGIKLPSDTADSLSYQAQINRCYWNYLRVYRPAGTQLLNATPHAVPGEWMLEGESVPARVDTLDEGIAGVQSFGTLFVVPTGATLETNFKFLLPSGVIQADNDPNKRVYELRVQKQPGTQAYPINVCVQLPDGSVIVKSSPAGDLKAGMWCLNSNLRTDVMVRLEFTVSSSFTPTQASYATVTPAPTDTRRTSSASLVSTPTRPAVHALETPFGTDTQFIIHRVRKGESLSLFSQRYETTVEAIMAVNYQLPTPLLVNFMIVIPVNQTNVSGFPAFEAYKVNKSISVEKLAIQQLLVDPVLLKYYNGLDNGRVLTAGEWVLVPHMATVTP